MASRDREPALRAARGRRARSSSAGPFTSLRYGSPTFMIPGAQKSGTTALASFLARHPLLEPATTKEPDFFLKEPRYARGEASYRRYFPRRHPFRRTLFFEASVGYLSCPSTPERLAAYDADLRFVVMVRDPALRALSAWNMYRRFVTVPSERARFEAWLADHNPEDRAAGLRLLAEPRFPSFAEIVSRELADIALAGPRWTLPAIVAGGLYAEQLERFLAFFPDDRFLVLEDRELADSSGHTLNRVLAFLGLPPHDWGDAFPRVFAGRYEGGPESPTLERLREFYAPHDRRFFELTGRSFEWPRPRKQPEREGHENPEPGPRTWVCSPPGKRAPADVAVAVVSWNTRELLRGCLRSLAADAEAGRAEVWVVDNASEDGSADMVRREFPWVRVVASPENLGFGAAVNLVAGRTSSEWIAPANADVELGHTALETLLAAGERHPEAGVVAPRLTLPDGSTQHSVYPLPTLRFTLLFNLGIHRLSRRLADRLCLIGYWNPERPREVGWPVGAFLLVRREAWDQVGGFDERQWMYAEDLDLGWRLARAGWSRRYEPAAVVRHAESAATRQAFGARRAATWMDATYEWMSRRRGLALTWAVATVNCAGAGARLAVLTFLARAWPARFERARRSARFWLSAHRAGLRRRPGRLVRLEG